MGQVKPNTILAALCLATFMTASAQMQPLNINTTGEPVTLTHHTALKSAFDETILSKCSLELTSSMAIAGQDWGVLSAHPKVQVSTAASVTSKIACNACSFLEDVALPHAAILSW